MKNFKKRWKIFFTWYQIALQCLRETRLIAWKMNFRSDWQQILDHTARSVNPQCLGYDASCSERWQSTNMITEKKRQPNFECCRGIFLCTLNCKCNLLICDVCLLPFICIYIALRKDRYIDGLRTNINICTMIHMRFGCKFKVQCKDSIFEHLIVLMIEIQQIAIRNHVSAKIPS